MSKEIKEEVLNKDLSLDEMIANALQKQQEQFEAKLKQRETNEVRLSCRIVDLSIIEGKAILDKETKQQKEVKGELQYYPNKYTGKLSFIGGEIEVPLTRELFETLTLYSQYLAIGRIGEVKEFGNTLIKPIFSTYTQI